MKPTMLMILDGFGCSCMREGNAIAMARTPNLDKLFEKYPHTMLIASGLDVGLPAGQMGNSEVGHLNIGAGRIVYQDLVKISKSIEDGDFFENPALLHAMDHLKKTGGALHLLGLLSDGGVHSHITHLFALLDMAKSHNISEVYIHCFLDGRDVPPKSAKTYIDQLEEYIDKIGVGKIVLISGRYYAMDRDKRWDRQKKAYDAMTLGIGESAQSAGEAIAIAYERGETDEFVLPTIITSTSDSFVPIKDGDALIMYNFRADRARQITRAFTDPSFDGFECTNKPKNLCYVCMTTYDATIPNVEIAFPPDTLKNTLGEYLSGLGLSQLRIAETEKYAHVTFFFNGGVEAPNPLENRILIASPNVATYDLKPEMSAYEVCEALQTELTKNKFDVIIVNFANADMVGHTGLMPAAISAIEALDDIVPRIVDTVLALDGQILLTADHGNADCMIDENGNPMTAHSTNPVPLMHISNDPKKLKDGGKLADIAPTLLSLMGLDIPSEMTGESLIIQD